MNTDDALDGPTDAWLEFLNSDEPLTNDCFLSEDSGLSLYFNPADAILNMTWPHGLNAGTEQTETTGVNGERLEHLEIFIEDERAPGAGGALARMIIDIGDQLRARAAKEREKQHD